jgi:molybdenum storage protein
MYDKDPNKHSDAKLIKKIGLDALLAHPPKELCLDKQLLDAWKNARHVERIQIVNGLKHGELTRALAGEAVGTIITRGAAHA